MDPKQKRQIIKLQNYMYLISSHLSGDSFGPGFVIHGYYATTLPSLDEWMNNVEWKNLMHAWNKKNEWKNEWINDKWLHE